MCKCNPRAGNHSNFRFLICFEVLLSRLSIYFSDKRGQKTDFLVLLHGRILPATYLAIRFLFELLLVILIVLEWIIQVQLKDTWVSQHSSKSYVGMIDFYGFYPRADRPPPVWVCPPRLHLLQIQGGGDDKNVPRRDRMESLDRGVTAPNHPIGYLEKGIRHRLHGSTLGAEPRTMETDPCPEGIGRVQPLQGWHLPAVHGEDGFADTATERLAFALTYEYWERALVSFLGCRWGKETERNVPFLEVIHAVPFLSGVLSGQKVKHQPVLAGEKSFAVHLNDKRPLLAPAPRGENIAPRDNLGAKPRRIDDVYVGAVIPTLENKISYITLKENSMIGIIIEDPFIYKMHKTLFEYLWQTN